jgi:hypothetical protein
MERNRTTVRRHTAGEALRHHGALETLIWSDTCGLSSCSSTVRRTRSFVLKAQYVKNVFVPGEGSGPAYRQAGLRTPRYGRGAIIHPEASGPPTRCALRSGDPCFPTPVLPRSGSAWCRDPLRTRWDRLKTANPVVSDRVRERSCVCSPLPCPVLGCAGSLEEILEAWFHRSMLPHAGCAPSLDRVWSMGLDPVGVLHCPLVRGAIIIDPC